MTPLIELARASPASVFGGGASLTLLPHWSAGGGLRLMWQDTCGHHMPDSLSRKVLWNARRLASVGAAFLLVVCKAAAPFACVSEHLHFLWPFGWANHTSCHLFDFDLQGCDTEARQIWPSHAANRAGPEGTTQHTVPRRMKLTSSLRWAGARLGHKNADGRHLLDRTKNAMGIPRRQE